MIKAGAGGNWHRLDEKFDASIVKQTDLSCVSAVGEMLLKERGIIVPQSEIRDIIGVPSYFEALARCLNKFDSAGDGKTWRSLITDERGLLILHSAGNLGVILQEPFSLGHAVYVSRKSQSDLFEVKDTFDQTSYLMTRAGFFTYWGGLVITRR